MQSASSFQVDISPPKIDGFADGTAGIPYIHLLDSGRPGPTAMISAVVHGNELCGAIVAAELLSSGFHPACGRLFVAFMNVAAFKSFDPDHPDQSRYQDEDFNRVWDTDRLDGPATTREVRRAQEVRPIVEQVDYLLDLHSTSSFSPPMMLSGLDSRAVEFARALGTDHAIICDAGHKAGRRMRDFDRFRPETGAGISLLVECGQHWQTGTVTVARDVTDRFLRLLDMRDGPTPTANPDQTVLTVTDAVTVMHSGLRFVESFNGLECIPKKGTPIALDGPNTIETPYDNCYLVMPTRHALPGQTAVRFARKAGI
ncbi:hypothetical protein HH303_17980 [Rhodospirillaceae bacterium KN72]|uniref:Succinylglutamate desuccinylase/Aspartoacylase catalytic domain-containing protein n=1 Tax=Pacificispira spongiicola TaxID=2729598 RepID=A0A7Y0HG06_9PROT|nr:succinylglutamate desuccinylase/aspartoacylase family protein [Pacificispira spongiicola]NMM46386.1 hypothetical protein [Pacificispira spongiicola]